MFEVNVSAGGLPEVYQGSLPVVCRRVYQGSLPVVCRRVYQGSLPVVCRRSAGSVPSSRALKITNDYYQRKKKSSIHTLWAKSAQPLFCVKFISCTRPLINWRGCGQTGTLCHPLYILCNTNLVI